jgi:hypothetical protein
MVKYPSCYLSQSYATRIVLRASSVWPLPRPKAAPLTPYHHSTMDSSPDSQACARQGCRQQDKTRHPNTSKMCLMYTISTNHIYYRKP